MLCGLAQSLVQIVLFRVLQGAFGAALVPLSQAVLIEINPKERQGSAMALFGMAVMVGPILGPVLGGEAQVPTISGAVRLKIPEGTQNGQVFRLKGHGMPAVGKPDDRGDLYATVDVQLPRSLTEEQREHYEALRKSEKAL